MILDDNDKRRGSMQQKILMLINLNDWNKFELYQ